MKQTKRTKALLINPVNQKVEEIEVETFEDIKGYLWCNRVEKVFQFENNDSLYVDEEALLKGNEAGFYIGESNDFIGNGIIIGVDDNGNRIDVKSNWYEIHSETGFFSGGL